jgi:hypothetical protein
MKENRRISVLAGIAAYMALPSGASAATNPSSAHPEHTPSPGSPEDHRKKEASGCAMHSH